MPTTHYLFSTSAMTARIARQALTAQLNKGQPQLTDGLELLGESMLGDVKVDLYGTVRFVGTRIADLYVEDVTVHGTTISLETVVGGKDWERFEEEARMQYAEATFYERMAARVLPMLRA